MSSNNSSIGRNYIYNFMYQLITIIIPVILIPYLARTLMANSIGEYSFNLSIVTYFSYASLLGVQLYGTKIISESRNDHCKMKSNFWQIFIIKCFTSLISITLFLILYIFKVIPSTNIILVQGMLLISNLIDVTWYFSGKENFKSIVVRNVFVRTLSLILIILFVKKPSDLLIYAVIMASSEILSQLVMWISLFKEKIYQGIFKLSIKKDLKRHFIGILILFIPQAITLLYNNVTITLLGIMSNQVEVAYFDMASKITNTMLVFITSLGFVIMPKISYLISTGEIENIKRILSKSLSFVLYLAYPMVLGFLVISPIIIPWFLGSEFSPVIFISIISMTKIVFISISNVIGIQYMIPSGKNKKYIISVLIGALTNIILSPILIPVYGAIGAAFAVLMSEIFVTIAQLIFTSKKLKFEKEIFKTYKSFMSSIIMLVVIYFLINNVPNNLFRFNGLIENVNIVNALYVGFISFSGCIVYFIFNMIFKTEIQFYLVSNIIKRFKKKNDY